MLIGFRTRDAKLEEREGEPELEEPMGTGTENKIRFSETGEWERKNEFGTRSHQSLLSTQTNLVLYWTRKFIISQFAHFVIAIKIWVIQLTQFDLIYLRMFSQSDS